MIKLQRLEITGFKSFADYTELVFTGNGITAIVGPNGCGKSNVADAIAWVLGEQKVKNLRGGEMKDVIFQGSKTRLPSGMAEVVLHMVRDEASEEEPDIDDIDATLEVLDDQAEAVEERLAPELDADTSAPDAEAKLTAPTVAAAAVVPNDSTTNAVEVSLFKESGAQASAATGPDSSALTSADEATGASRSRPSHHKRHWRPRRLAPDFAPGESVSA